MIRFATAICCLIMSHAGAMACVVIGDSIALGTGRVMTECTTKAQGGLTSAQILDRMQQEQGPAVVSAGTNDRRQELTREQTEQNLRAIRAKITGPVIWILPVNGKRPFVEAVAATLGDRTVSFVPRPHNVHPQSYEQLADDLRALLKR